MSRWGFINAEPHWRTSTVADSRSVSLIDAYAALLVPEDEVDIDTVGETRDDAVVEANVETSMSLSKKRARVVSGPTERSRWDGH